MEFRSRSGAKVVINCAPWVEAKILKRAIETELAGRVNLAVHIFDQSLIPIILALDGCEAIDAALWPCLERCLYNNMKITNEIFDDEKARADYYQIVEACLRRNFAPLAAGLSSELIKYGILKQASPDDTQK